MSYTRLIHDYLDGEIAGSTQEEVLFNVLASDEELRSEFKRQVRIHTIAQKDMAQLLPPAALTNSVFAGLGFAAPGMQAMNPENSSNFSAILRKYSSILLLLLLTFSVAGVGYFYFENISLKENFSNKSNTNGSNLASQNNYPISSSYESIVPFIDGDYAQINQNISVDLNDSRNSLNRNSSTPVSKSNAISSANNSSIVSLVGNDDFGLTNHSHIISASNIFSNLDKLFTSLNNSNMSSSMDLASASLTGNFNASDYYLDNSKWQVIFRRISPFSYDADYLSSRLDNPVNNFSLTLFRKINQYHSIGLEIGSEQFSQVFPSSNEKISYTQMQNPMLIWAGATYRFTAIDFVIPYKLYPYAQLSASGTTIGPIIRGQFGMNWQLANNFNIVLGYDYGALFYNVSGNIYNSPKSGLIFGAGVKF